MNARRPPWIVDDGPLAGRWALGYGLCGLAGGVFWASGVTQGGALSFTMLLAVVCSCFLVRNVWQLRKTWSRGKFVCHYVLAWGCVAGAIVGVVRVQA